MDEQENLEPYEPVWANAVMHGPPGTDIGDLHCRIAADEDGQVVTESAWQPNALQRQMVKAGANIRLAVWQHPIPPLAVMLEFPTCEVCEQTMVYVIDRAMFRCPAGHG